MSKSYMKKKYKVNMQMFLRKKSRQLISGSIWYNDLKLLLL